MTTRSLLTRHLGTPDSPEIYPGARMGLTDELEAETKAIFRAAWTERDGIVVPEPNSIQLGNDAVNLDAVILYADIAASTKLVDNYNKEFAAEIYGSSSKAGEA